MPLLQALSLQLTYDNLMIVIHRPLLADQGYRRSRTQVLHPRQLVNADGESSSSQEIKGTNDISFRQCCLSSALRISRVQQSKRNLLALARSTHTLGVLFGHEPLYLFRRVVYLRALRDSSDIAQESKRGMARNHKMLKLLSGDG